ncbi:penicillin-binding protein [Bailinhaonella thermotolerans]|uniref:Penicillin-binding protein n=1 Tax=Bailinhaonella thermotolerans TaxID=1070861 RepID=A0A3A4A9W7_9ACTN|nr:penicillin-binding protein [Bailinhaonella thermotolerans]
MAAKSAADGFQQLPAELHEAPLAELTRLYDKNGKQFAQFYNNNRESIRLDQVSEHMRKAVVAIEDSRFYEHGGIDFKGTIRAFSQNAQTGAVRQGGSSLTQQYVKNVLKANAKTEKERRAAEAPNYGRKLTELRYAVALEEKYSKDTILERYLNISYFGSGAYGVQAAAKRYFGKPAAKLTLPEAATLAGIIHWPNRYELPSGLPKKQRQAHEKAMLERRNVTLDRMKELGVVSPQEYQEARASKLNLKLTPAPGGCEESDYPYFCMYVKQEILNNPAFGATFEEREARLNSGGMKIYTTLDPKMQKASEKALRKYVGPKETEVASQAMIEPGTGEIKALASSKKFGPGKGETMLNLAADAKHGGGTGFQAGSTFKAITLATALDEGWKFNQGMRTPGSFSSSSANDFKNCKGDSVGDPSHTVFNSSGEGKGGSYSLSTGTWSSVNVFFMMLEQEVGLCDTVEMAKKLGIKKTALGRDLVQVPTFTLGVNEMDPLTVANAYATFGARGKYCTPMAITEIKERNGKSTKIKPSCKQAIDEGVADAVSHVLQGVFTKGTMSGVGGIGRDAAGKTGTTDGYMTAWFAGYTPDLASAVSIGDIRGAYQHPLTNVKIGGQYYGSVQGASIPGPIWVKSMREALEDVEATSFHAPDFGRFGGGYTPPSEDEKKKDEEDEDGGPDVDIPRIGNGNDWFGRRPGNGNGNGNGRGGRPDRD